MLSGFSSPCNKALQSSQRHVCSVIELCAATLETCRCKQANCSGVFMLLLLLRALWRDGLERGTGLRVCDSVYL